MDCPLKFWRSFSIIKVVLTTSRIIFTFILSFQYYYFLIYAKLWYDCITELNKIFSHILPICTNAKDSVFGLWFSTKSSTAYQINSHCMYLIKSPNICQSLHQRSVARITDGPFAVPIFTSSDHMPEREPLNSDKILHQHPEFYTEFLYTSNTLLAAYFLLLLLSSRKCQYWQTE